MDVEETKKEIKKLLYQIPIDLKGKSGNEIWTKTIKERLTSLGNEKGYGVAVTMTEKEKLGTCEIVTPSTKEIEADRGKWLYGLTWWSYKSGHHPNNMTSINLAAEIKWRKTKGVSRVLGYEDSFLKLVYAKAKLKLFVFDAVDKDKYEKISNQLENLANMCEDRDGDEYLLYCTVWIEGKEFTFMYKTFTAQKEESDIKKIKRSLNQIAINLNGKSERKIWTEAIKKSLTSLGQENGYSVATDGAKKANHREWLYDLIWWKYKDNHFNNMININLAVESEWDCDLESLEDDFLKLVYAKAKLKLFIFGAYDEDDYIRRSSRLKELANMCEDRSGDKYLFSCSMTDDSYKFKHECFTAESR